MLELIELTVQADFTYFFISDSGDGNYIAATSSNHTIRLFSGNNLAGVGVITGKLSFTTLILQVDKFYSN